jgi:hypothetical protein
VVSPFLGDAARPHREIAQALAEAYPDVPEEALRHVTRERLPLLQVPPRGLWKRSGGVIYAYVDRYLGRAFVEADVEDLVRRYLAAYGPATAADMTKWSMVTRLGPVFTAMTKAGKLRTCTDEHGRTLYDVPDGVIAEEDLPLPILMLGNYDNLFLSHADRDRIASDAARREWMGTNGASRSTLFVDGLLAGTWRYDGQRFDVEVFGPLSPTQRREVGQEQERIAAMLAR